MLQRWNWVDAEARRKLLARAMSAWTHVMSGVYSLAMTLIAAVRGAIGYWLGLNGRQKRTALAGVAVIAALWFVWTWRDVPGHWLAYVSGNRPLFAAKSWYYHLDKIDVAHVAKQTADVIVMDYATTGGRVPLTPEEVARIKIRPDGSKRLVISYMSIGEAEQYRYYYRTEWKEDPPEWLEDENCAWPGAHKVKFWHDQWKDIIWRGRKSYLKRIIDAGFDGVYLDRVDIYDVYADRPTARADMIQFIKDLSQTAKKLRPGFFVLPQNADDLLTEPDYRAAIDGLGREDMLFGGDETGKRNPVSGIRQAQSRLDLLLWEWKPVFAVEYLQTQPEIDRARKEMLGRGLVPTFQPRGLDGTDPTAPVDLAAGIGTAEFIRSNCSKGKAW